MASNFGTKLQIGSGSPVTYADIAKILKVELPEILNEKLEVSNHASVLRDYESSGLAGVGEFKCTVLIEDFDLIATVLDGTKTAMKIVFPGTLGEWTFSGIITAFKPNEADAQNPEALQAELTIQPTADIDFGLA